MHTPTFLWERRVIVFPHRFFSDVLGSKESSLAKEVLAAFAWCIILVPRVCAALMYLFSLSIVSQTATVCAISSIVDDGHFDGHVRVGFRGLRHDR